MGRYSAVKSSSIVVQDMYEFFDFGGMRRAKFGREMFEKVTDLVGGDHSDAQTQDHPEQVSGSDFSPGEVDNQDI